MTALTINGLAALSAAGDRPEALAERATALAGERHPGVPVGGIVTEDLPRPEGHALLDFDVRARLGRRGTSFYDRATALAVVACGDALTDSGLTVDDANRARVGVVLGTTVGSLKSTSDYTRETLVQEKPYLVNPMLFPNTVMNCAAGQAAIRHKLKGINATVTGGPLAFFNALRYAGNAIRRGYVDTMLVGAVEEFSAHRAWASASGPAGGEVPAGEGAAVFVIGGGADSAGRATICAVTTGYGPDGTAEQALTDCVARALHVAGAAPTDVTLLATSETSTAGTRPQRAAALRALDGHVPAEFVLSRVAGDCGAATPALALAAALRLPADGDRSGLILLTAHGTDGGVGAALVRR
ncbi:beta-ketoacyl synthase [Verrucosispora sp. ts21]|uniref:beta-ketoacyl synthase N-terminal-like domain-containing protein n=1 Tax=Verrucosispora sp. ts21 TaxID=2069341 RepID=UPI000C885C11|nr:beta-ketoacyl synthase N-terminal-like domain-containing protein [Verrucosispora sp. ts21]PMR62050.1 beta-ketoacyl synthase [Verrucosispora sp. ts21]